MAKPYYRILRDNPLIIYTGEDRVFAAVALLDFGIEQFRKTIHFSKRKELLSDLEQARDRGIFGEYIAELGNDTLIESTRIIVCFQNFMFALLLSKDYLIHKVDRSTHRGLASKQRRKPIEILSLSRESSYLRSADGYDLLQGVRNETINFTTLLTNGYQKVIQLPPLILDTLKEYYGLRNFQHFHIMESTPAIAITILEDGSRECRTIDQITALNDFVKNDMTLLLKILQQQVDDINERVSR